jgi:flagellar basal-body rod modification protein FlgD
MTYISNTQFYNPLVDGYDAPSSTKDLGKNDFLNLLVTQLQNQNPLEPMQDQEFISQLAQFSQLEQLSNMSETLDTNSQVNYLMSQSIANTMAVTLIGKTVVAEGADFNLKPGEDVGLSYNLSAGAETVTINVLDESGTLVKTIHLNDVAKGNNTYTWDGHNSSGTALSPGKYSYEVHATSRTGEEVDVTKRVIGEIESVKYDGGKAYLVVGGYELDLSTIIEIVQNRNSAIQSGS